MSFVCMTIESLQSVDSIVYDNRKFAKREFDCFDNRKFVKREFDCSDNESSQNMLSIVVCGVAGVAGSSAVEVLMRIFRFFRSLSPDQNGRHHFVDRLL